MKDNNGKLSVLEVESIEAVMYTELQEKLNGSFDDDSTVTLFAKFFKQRIKVCDIFLSFTSLSYFILQTK